MTDRPQSTPADSESLFLGCREQFPSLQQTINGQPVAYFDGPGGTQVPRAVIEAIRWYYETCNANTHGAFASSRESDRVIEQARESMAAFLHAEDASQISFGANMTTLNFSLSRAVGRALTPGDEVLITQLDHEANRGPWLRLRELGIGVREIPMLPDGTLDYSSLDSRLNERTRLVAVGQASNALGTLNDIARIRQATRRVGALLLVDAVHSAPHFPLRVGAMGVDFLLCSAYKFYGPHVGILYSRKNLLDQFDTDRLRTQDGVAPYRIETGTLNHAALAGVSAAVSFIAGFGEGATLAVQVDDAMQRIQAHEHALARRLHRGLAETVGVTLFGPGFETAQRAPTVSFRISGLSPAAAAKRLAENGLAVWDGDFYAARAVELLGLAEQGGLIRVGMSLYNTLDEVDRLLEAIRSLAQVNS